MAEVQGDQPGEGGEGVPPVEPLVANVVPAEVEDEEAGEAAQEAGGEARKGVALQVELAELAAAGLEGKEDNNKFTLMYQKYV